VKEEMFHHDRFDTVEDFIRELEEYLGWYNTTRISTTLGGLSPVEYRAQTLVA
jgi:putative transposase